MWDAFQREMLSALGHEVVVLATAKDAGSIEATPAKAAPVRVPFDATGMPPLQQALVRAVGGDPTRLAGLAPLQQALLRAVGGDPARLAGLPSLDQLRTPAAKRALWPRLRALRRDSRS